MPAWAGCALVVVLAVNGALVSAQDEARRPRVGLALSGGSARGIAHVGVLRWLEENHVPVDAIAGTSSGAYIGGAYATGLSAAEIQKMLAEADWDMILRPDIPYALKSQRRKE
ncbi:MAG: patatin-like phospholipase family protein, partial [Vicinamibacteria bacterium]